MLTDADLEELNRILEWNCFTVDGRGRRFGSAAWRGKRTHPQVIPDPRIVDLDRRFPLDGKCVLEIGCFEGIHTIALCGLTARVKAIDSRIDNVVKTIVRCAFFGKTPQVFKYDVEATPADVALLEADVAHHVGVLYHLRDPAAHIVDLGRYVGEAVMLDTHYALEEEATEEYESLGRRWPFKRFLESGLRDPFSGMYDHAKWLRLQDIIELLEIAGFDKAEIAEDRRERNGPRTLIYAERTSSR
jgi:tRNA (mo5U34)-methyltransferase